METKWQKLIGDITETAEDCKKQKRNYLFIVDNDDKYQTFAGGSFKELSKILATNMLRRENFQELIMDAVKTFMNIRNSQRLNIGPTGKA